MKGLSAVGVAVVMGLAPQEPVARRVTGTPVRVPGDLATISGVAELRDGRLIVSDATRAAVYVVEAKAGVIRPLGSIGADSSQYAQPGGFYAGVADTVYLLDRGQAKFLVIAPSGVIVGSRSIRVKGRSGSSSDDVDHQRVDAHGLAYFIDMATFFRSMGGQHPSDSAGLVRFDASHQHGDTVAQLRQHDKKVTIIDEHSQSSQIVAGSPEDDWGVASNGRVAVVRGSPYRVEWIAPDGRVTRGSTISVDAIAYAQAEKDSISARAGRAGGGVSAGLSGQSAAKATAPAMLFAATKAAFDPGAASVSPDGHVWVARNQRAGAASTLYDVFDGRGERVDRIELPVSNRVIGFGKSAVYAVTRDATGHVALFIYKL